MGNPVRLKIRHKAFITANAAAVLVLAFGAPAFSANETNNRVPASLRAAEALSTPSHLFYNGESPIAADLIENYREVKETQKKIDAKEYIPLNMEPTNSSSEVISAIADKSVGHLLNDPEWRASPLGQTTTSVEKNLKQDVVIGGNQPDEIQHKFNFSIQAFQTRAEVDYEGITNAKVAYQASSATTLFEIFEKLPTAQKQQVVLSHEIRPDQRISNLSLRWNW